MKRETHEPALTDAYATAQRERLIELDQRAHEMKAGSTDYWRVKREQNALTDWFRSHAWSIGILREDELHIQRLIREWRAEQPYVIITGINIQQREKQVTIEYECCLCKLRTLSPRVIVYHLHSHDDETPSQEESINPPVKPI